jgi:hypothetical protein
MFMDIFRFWYNTPTDQGWGLVPDNGQYRTWTRKCKMVPSSRSKSALKSQLKLCHLSKWWPNISLLSFLLARWVERCGRWPGDPNSSNERKGRKGIKKLYIVWGGGCLFGRKRQISLCKFFSCFYLWRLFCGTSILSRPHSVWRLTTDWTVGVRFLAGWWIFSFTASRPTVRPSQLPIQRIPEALCQKAKRPRREAAYLSPFNIDVKNGGAIPPLPYMSSWQGQLNHNWFSRLNFTRKYFTASL